MAEQILMPKATAVWLVDNTSMTFEQIADFCGLHHLEVKGIADGEVARDIRGADPIANGQLTREELDKAQSDPSYRMVAHKSRHAELLKPTKKAPHYTPVSRRQDRPDAIAWFLRNHPEVTDAQISKALGTTKATIDQVRNRTLPRRRLHNFPDAISFSAALTSVASARRRFSFVFSASSPRSPGASSYADSTSP